MTWQCPKCKRWINGDTYCPVCHINPPGADYPEETGTLLVREEKQMSKVNEILDHPGTPPLSSKDFEHKGLLTTERIYPESYTQTKHHLKMVWARAQFDKVIAGPDNTKNPLFHSDFEPGQEDRAREIVRVAYEEYWGLDKP